MSTAIPADLGDALYALKLVFQKNPIPKDRTPRMQRDDLIQQLADYGISFIQASKLIDHLVGAGVFEAHDPTMREGDRFEANIKTTIGFDGTDWGTEITPIRKIVINRVAWESFIAGKSDMGRGEEPPANNATSPTEESLRAPQQLLEAFGKAASRFPDCPRMLAFLNSGREDGLVTVPPSFIPRKANGQPVVGQLNIGGTAKMVFGHNATFYGIGGARVASENGNLNIGFVLYGAGDDEAVAKFRELGSEAGVAVHVRDMVPGIQNYDRPLVLWALIVYSTLQGSTWLSQIDGVAENPTLHFNPFAASVETLKRLLARNVVKARNSPTDVPLDQSTMAAGQAMLAHIDSLAGTNTTMRNLVVDLGARHAGEAPLQPSVIVTRQAAKLRDPQSDAASEVVPPAMLAEQTDPVSRAIALLLAADKEGRPINIIDLPAIVGCSRSKLYRDKHFKATVKALKAKKRANIPKGSKTKEGNLEAEYDPAEE
jgi:hypothetical protein